MKIYNFLFILFFLLNYSCTQQANQEKINRQNSTLQILQDSLKNTAINIEKPFLIYTFRQSDCLACNVSYSNIENYLKTSNINIPRIFIFQDIKRTAIVYMLENDLKIVEKPFFLVSDSLFQYFNSTNQSSVVLMKNLSKGQFSVVPLKEAGDIKEILAPLLNPNESAVLKDSVILQDHPAFPLQDITYFHVVEDSILYFLENHLRIIFKYDMKTDEYQKHFELPESVQKSVYNTVVKATETEKAGFQARAKKNLIPPISYAAYQIINDSIYITSEVSIQQQTKRGLEFRSIPVLSICDKNFNIVKNYFFSTKNTTRRVSFYQNSYTIENNNIWCEAYTNPIVSMDSLIYNVQLVHEKDSLVIIKNQDIRKPTVMISDYSYPQTVTRKYKNLYNHFWVFPALLNVTENKTYRINENYVSEDYKKGLKENKESFFLYNVELLSKNLHEFLYLKDDNKVCLLVQDSESNVLSYRVLMNKKPKAVFKQGNFLYTMGLNKDKNVVVYQWNL